MIFLIDYEIVKEGFYYQDPEIPLGKPTWQYTSVPVDYKLPDVKYELLEECYIPDEEDSGLKGTSLGNFYEQLEYEAFRITGNLKMFNNLKSTKGFWSKKQPEGIIRVYNNAKKSGSNSEIGLEGIMGVKVRVHNFVKWDTEYTDENGYYKMSKSYRTNVHYAIVFENKTGFLIWGNWAFFACANYNMGWHPNSGHSRDIYSNSQAWLWANINNAAYIYSEKLCPKFGILKPPLNTTIWALRRTSSKWAGSAPMLRHIVFTTEELNSMQYGINITFEGEDNWYLGNFSPDLFIYNKTDAKAIYSTVFHELSHASHFSKVGQTYWKKYVKHIVDNKGYGKGTEPEAGYCGVGEMWANYFGNYICCRDYFGSEYGYDPDELWYNPGFLQYSVSYTRDLTTGKVYSCLKPTVTDIEKLRTELKTQTSYGTQVDRAYTIYPDWPK